MIAKNEEDGRAAKAERKQRRTEKWKGGINGNSSQRQLACAFWPGGKIIQAEKRRARERKRREEETEREEGGGLSRDVIGFADLLGYVQGSIKEAIHAALSSLTPHRRSLAAPRTIQFLLIPSAFHFLLILRLPWQNYFRQWQALPP